MMEKILIVNNNMDIGGIQKSLLNLLREVSGEYDITLLLLSRSGALLKEVPEGVRVITPARRYRMLGLPREELRRYPLLMALKWLLKKYAAMSSRRNAMRVLGVFQKKIRGYDRVISYSHLTSAKGFDNGCADFVLDKTVSPRKICFVHCDYSAEGYCSPDNNARYGEFDRIACCSDSVRARFTELSGIDSDKVCTVRNFADRGVAEKSRQDRYEYDGGYLNLVTVARLSPEKGVSPALDALHASGREDIRYCVVGGGPEKSRLEAKVKALGMENRVVFESEQLNPYRYMAGADYLLVPSLHEAAPLVFDEAHALGLPVISSDTLSAREMLSPEDIIYSGNTELTDILRSLQKSTVLQAAPTDNSMQMSQLGQL